MDNKFLAVNKEFFNLGLKSLDILILSQIDEFSRNNHECYVTNQQLSDMFGESVRTIDRSLKKLEELNYIRRNTFISKTNGQASKIRIMIVNYQIVLPNKNTDTMGIYKIENIKNGKVYIGRSKNIKKRWEQHLYELENGTHHSFKLQKAYDQLKDKSVLQFSIIEEVQNEEDLLEREQYWIDYYDAFHKGYNCSEKADNPKYVHKNIQKKKVRRQIDNI